MVDCCHEAALASSSSSQWAIAMKTFFNGAMSGRSSLSHLIRSLRRQLFDDAANDSCRAMPQPILSALTRSTLMASVESEEAMREAMRFYRLVEPHLTDPSAFTRSAVVAMFSNERNATRTMRQLAHAGNWKASCQLLNSHGMTEMTLAAGVEAYCVGAQWQQAIEILLLMKPLSWTERELAVILGAMYRVARKEVLQRGPNEFSVPSTLFWATALNAFERFVTLKGRQQTAAFTTPTSVNNLIGILGSARQWERATEVLQRWSLPRDPSCDALQPVGQVASSLRPTSVTVARVCSLYGTRRWEMAMSFVGANLSRTLNEEDIDVDATNRLLRACSAGQRWREANRLLDSCVKNGVRLPHQDCVRLMRAFGQSAISTKTASDTHAISALPRRVFQEHLSRHGNPDVMSRAANSMLQHATSVDDAAFWRSQLEHGNAVVENESLDHLVALYAQHGDWSASLECLSLLLCDPARKFMYVPSSTTHDWAQYALSSAPSPGASWTVSVSLFSEMASRHVPLSEVSFQSVVKKCFAQQSMTAANSVFAFMMKRGVGRK